MNEIEPYHFDRLPPSSIDAEVCVLASLMLAMPDDPMIAGINSLIGGEDFFQADHQIIFETIQRMRAARKPIDGISVCNELESKKLLQEIGGREYVGRIFNTVPSAAHGEHYAKIVLGTALKRRLIAISNDALRMAYTPHEVGDEAKMLTDIASKLCDAAMRGRGAEVRRLGDVAREIYEGRSRPEVFDRIKTRLDELDACIGGLPIRGHTLIAGKPGMGKSALAKQILANIAFAGAPVGIISIEETAPKIAGNVISSATGVPNNRIRFNTANEQEWSLVELALAEIDDLPFFIVDSASTISSIISMAELLRHRHHCQVIAVDHAHLIDAEAEKHQNREREISKISSSLKMTWKRLGVAGVLCAQLNRGSGRDRPTKENLRDSGTLEQDGDVIIIVHREDYYRKQDAAAGAEVQMDNVLELIIDKNKDGAVGNIPVRFDEKTQLIRDLRNLTEAEAAQQVDDLF